MDDIKRYEPSSEAGLSEEQVQERKAQGLQNEYRSNATKTYGQIIKDNVLTFFNILNIILAGLLIAVGAYKDLFFVVIVLANFTIGLVQELSSKRTLDKLAVIVAAKVNVIRSGVMRNIAVNEIVLDDVMELKTGNQICADAILLSGYLEVNESLISGESDVIIKKEGDFLYSGSFVVSGSGRARVDHVGADNYANQISASAKAAKKRKSELYSTLGVILRVISIIIIPMGVLLFYKQNVILGMLPNEAIVKTVAGVIGMIPEGLILMTSIALVTSTIFLAYDHTLVQDVYGIETMARVHTLCLDKTGTLTEGKLAYDSSIPLSGMDYEKAMRNICGASQDENSTITALRAHFVPAHDFQAAHIIPFSSERKYSGVSFTGQGTYVMGATEFIFPQGREDLKIQAEQLTQDGKRVILLAHSAELTQENTLPGSLVPVAFILIADKIRSDAKKTLDYFAQQGVEIKVISGDHPKTVSSIARQAGMEGAESYIDVSTLETPEELREATLQYHIFGRVSPHQKKDMVAALKESGKKVAMMGDGVNDVLALKEADCSVAVASGSDAAKNISDIVLMDSNLVHLEHVVTDGRKIINNIQRVATLFITKTVYSVLLALATLFLFESAYPFTPLQLVIMSFVTIGAPSFFLALEPNYDRIEGQFIKNVLAKSLPGGLSIMLGIILVNVMTGYLGFSANELSTMCVYVAVAGGLWVLAKVSNPWTWIRKVVMIGMIGLFLVAVIFFGNFFEIHMLSVPAWIVVAVLVAVMPLLMKFFEWIMNKIYAGLDKRKDTKLMKKLRDMGEKGAASMQKDRK